MSSSSNSGDCVPWGLEPMMSSRAAGVRSQAALTKYYRRSSTSRKSGRAGKLAAYPVAPTVSPEPHSASLHRNQRASGPRMCSSRISEWKSRSTRPSRSLQANGGKAFRSIWCVWHHRNRLETLAALSPGHRLLSLRDWPVILAIGLPNKLWRSGHR